VAASEITDEPSNYLPNSFGHGVEALELSLSQVAEIEGDVEMALYFYGRGLRDGQVTDEFHLSASAETLRDVSHH